MLLISREEFREIYAGLAILAYEDLFYSKPINELDMWNNYLPSKLWRLNNMYMIVDKRGNKIKFNMNRSQHIVYAASLRHPRLIILKSRQQGISTLWLVSFFDDALTRPDYYIGLMAQGLDESETLLKRTKILWDNLHSEYKQYFNVQVSKDNTQEFSLTNGSSIFIRTSFRSATLQRLHISEMGKIANKYPDKAAETKTGTLQAIAVGNIAIVESTAEGDNIFKDMWDNAVTFSRNITEKDFYPIFLSWLDDPDCNIEQDQPITTKQAKYFSDIEQQIKRKITRTQKNFWIVQYRELGEKIYQEYPSTANEAFMATRQGAYYAIAYLDNVKEYKREVEDLYDKNLDVQIAVDLGMDDTNVLIPFQTYKKEFRIIDEFYDNGQPIMYYTNWIKEQPWWPNLTHVILPHDAEVRELTSGLTRTEVFERELCDPDLEGGIPGRSDVHITVNPKSSINDGIDMVREMIKTLFIVTRCEYIIKCITNYSKEWDERKEKFRNKPNHNEYSNGADALRAMAVGATRDSKPRRVIASNDGTKVKESSYHSRTNATDGMDV